jgi:hypothetical protein
MYVYMYVYTYVRTYVYMDYVSKYYVCTYEGFRWLENVQFQVTFPYQQNYLLLTAG